MSEETEEKTIRQNPLTVISVNTFGDYHVRDIQSNSAWGGNPYPDYAVVPDDMVEAVMETHGFCEITLNEDGTEVVDFIALEVPDIPEPEEEPTAEDDMLSMIVDQEYRLTLLELEVM